MKQGSFQPCFYLDSEKNFESNNQDLDKFINHNLIEDESIEESSENCISNNSFSQSFSRNQGCSNISAKEREISLLLNAMTDYILMNFNENLESLENLYQTSLSLTTLKNLPEVQAILQLKKGRIQCLKCQKFKKIHEIRDIWCNKSSCKICINCRNNVQDSCLECRRLYSDKEKMLMSLRNC